MRIDYSVISDGSMNDRILWICALAYTDMSKKPIRHVEPTRVIIVRYQIIYAGLDSYDTYFVPLNRNGEMIQKKAFIAYGRPTWHINIFDNEEECINEYLILCKRALEKLKEWITAQHEIHDGQNQRITHLMDKYR
jgi:hypothetical protein